MWEVVWRRAVADHRERPGRGGALASLGLELTRESGERARGRADRRRLWCETDGNRIGVGAGEVAGEVGWLVQVDPERVDVNAGLLVEEDGELVGLEDAC